MYFLLPFYIWALNYLLCDSQAKTYLGFSYSYSKSKTMCRFGYQHFYARHQFVTASYCFKSLFSKITQCLLEENSCFNIYFVLDRISLFNGKAILSWFSKHLYCQRLLCVLSFLPHQALHVWQWTNPAPLWSLHSQFELWFWQICKIYGITPAQCWNRIIPVAQKSWVLLMPWWAKIHVLQLPSTMTVILFVLDEMQNQVHLLGAINDPTPFPSGHPHFASHITGFIYFSDLHFTLRLVFLTFR